MFKHRMVFAGSWITLTIALVVFPGFEGRALGMGFIIGCWPFLIFGHLLFDAIHQDLGIVCLIMLLSSGATVGLCAWVMDRARLTKKVWMMLLISIIAGVCVIYALNDYGFEDWKRSPEISAAMESPEVNYKPTRSDFNREILIPKMLDGGMWGLYVATVLGFLYSIAIIHMRKRRLKSQMQALTRS